MSDTGYLCIFSKVRLRLTDQQSSLSVEVLAACTGGGGGGGGFGIGAP